MKDAGHGCRQSGCTGGTESCKRQERRIIALLKTSLRFAVFLLLGIFGFIEPLSAQSLQSLLNTWTKRETLDNWGDVSGYAYYYPVLATGNSNYKDIPMGLSFGWHPSLGDKIMIGAEPIDKMQSSPANPFMDEPITFSVRTGVNTKVYDGSTLSNQSTWQFVMMLVSCDDFITQLHQNGAWDVLIEAGNWYIRTTIQGNLPKE